MSVRRGLLVASLLTALAGGCTDSASPRRDLLPTGTCTMNEFLYQTAAGASLGRPLQGSFIVRSRIAADSAARFTATDQPGLDATLSLDGGGSQDRPYYRIVPAGDFIGFWLLRSRGDVLWISVADSGLSHVRWAHFLPWQVRGRTLVADWGTLSANGWHLEATVACH